jgi:tetratricopeptide (TPR) repeat protein
MRTVLWVAAAALCLLSPAPMSAQMGQLEGFVFGPDGDPIAGAVVTFDFTERSTHAQVKTDKKGFYQLSTLLPGTYNVTVAVNGKLRARRLFFRVVPGRQDPADFANGYSPQGLIFRLNPPDGPIVELRSEMQGSMESNVDSKNKNRKGGAAGPAAPGPVPSPGAGGDKSAAQKQALNTAYTAAKAALDAKQFDDAIARLDKANELDPKQPAVWSLMGDAFMKRSAVRGADQSADQAKAADAYRKAIELKPNEAAYYNNYSLALARIGKLDEARTNLAKAIELDPGGAGTYHYNLGAFLLSASQNDAAIEEFRKSIAADPGHASSYFQIGVALSGKATVDSTGKLQPASGTLEALQKCLELDPSGVNSQAARDMIVAMGGVAPAKKGK